MDVQVESTSVVEPKAPVTDAKAETTAVGEGISESKAKASDETSDESEASGKGSAQEASDEAGGDEQGETDSKQDPKGVKKRVDKLNARIAQERQEKEYWREQAMKSQAKPAQEETQAQAKPVAEQSAEGKPLAEQFESHSEYVEALAEWKFEQKQAAFDKQQREARLKTEFESRQRTYQEKANQFAKEHDDFNELIAELGEYRLSPTVHDAVIDFGPELAYELAKNREELDRINALSPVAAGRALGRIEERIAKKETKKPEVKQSSAPAPLSPVNAKGAAVAKSLDEMDYDEFKRARNEQSRKR